MTDMHKTSTVRRLSLTKKERKILTLVQIDPGSLNNIKAYAAMKLEPINITEQVYAVTVSDMLRQT